MKTRLALAGLIIALLPAAAQAAPAKSKVATAYECSKCHMKVTAAVAKKDGYKDPMDGGKLVPTKSTKK